MEPFIGIGEDLGFNASTVHQQTLTIGPFSNTYEADVVSLEVVMRWLQDRDVYNHGEYQVDLTQEQHNIHISLINLDLLCASTYHLKHNNAIMVCQ